MQKEEKTKTQQVVKFINIKIHFMEIFSNKNKKLPNKMKVTS